MRGGVCDGRRLQGLPQFCAVSPGTKSPLHSSRRTADPRRRQFPAHPWSSRHVPEATMTLRASKEEPDVLSSPLCARGTAEPGIVLCAQVPCEIRVCEA